MADPKSNNKTLWLLIIGLLAVVGIIFILNPTSGEDEAAIEAAVDEASIDRDDTLSDYPVQAEPYGEEGAVETDMPAEEGLEEPVVPSDDDAPMAQ